MFTALVSEQEQDRLAWDLRLPDFRPIKKEKAKLVDADYTIKGLEDFLCIKKKSKSQILRCMGSGRKDFEIEIKRMLSYENRVLIIEASWADFESGNYDAMVTPTSAMGSLLGWVAKGVPIIMAGDSKTAARYASKLMIITYNRRIREHKNMTAKDTKDG